MWRSVGFLMSFAVVLEGIAIVAYIVILSGGKQLRESGWGILSLIIMLSAAVQAASTALVVGRGNLTVCHVVPALISLAHRPGIPFRQRRTLLRGMEPRPILVLLHRQLVHFAVLRRGGSSCSPRPSVGRRLRTHT